MIRKKKGFRALSLAKMSFTVVADIATHKAKCLLTGHDDEIERSKLNHKVGQELAQTLSEMKGPLMKVGQIFAQVKDILPQEISDALGQLRQYATPIEFETIREQILLNLGQYPEDAFEWFDETPYRAASLGQVHKARLHTGEDVVVKVQYPEIQKDCAADLKHLKNLFRLLPLIGVDSQSLDLVYLEIEEVIQRELDYKLEAATMQKFHDYFLNSDKVVVPVPILSKSGSTVLTMTYEKGESLESFQKTRSDGRGDDTLTRQVSENLYYSLVEQIFNLKMIHVDPHAGNFAVKPDGRIIIFDFGAIKELGSDVIEIFKLLVESMLKRNIPDIEKYLFQKGIRKAGTGPLDNSFYDPWLDILTGPFILDQYDFSQSSIHQEAMHLAKQRWKYTQQYFRPSRDTLLLDRLIMGHYWNFVHLKSNFSLKDQLINYIHY